MLGDHAQIACGGPKSLASVGLNITLPSNQSPHVMESLTTLLSMGKRYKNKSKHEIGEEKSCVQCLAGKAQVREAAAMLVVWCVEVSRHPTYTSS